MAITNNTPLQISRVLSQTLAAFRGLRAHLEGFAADSPGCGIRRVSISSNAHITCSNAHFSMFDKRKVTCQSHYGADPDQPGQCAQGWGGKFCDKLLLRENNDAAPCDSNPCWNGGRCSQCAFRGGCQGGFRCACPAGVRGRTCTEPEPGRKRVVALWSRDNGRHGGSFELSGKAYQGYADLPEGFSPAFAAGYNGSAILCGGQPGGIQQGTRRCVRWDPADERLVEAARMRHTRGVLAKGHILPNGDLWAVGGDVMHKCLARRASSATSEILGAQGWRPGPSPPTQSPVACFAQVDDSRTFVATHFRTSWTVGSEFWMVDWNGDEASWHELPAPALASKLVDPLCTTLPDGSILVSDRGFSNEEFYYRPGGVWTLKQEEDGLGEDRALTLRPGQEKLAFILDEDGPILAASQLGSGEVSLHRRLEEGNGWRKKAFSSLAKSKVNAPRREDALLAVVDESFLGKR